MPTRLSRFAYVAARTWRPIVYLAPFVILTGCATPQSGAIFWSKTISDTTSFVSTQDPPLLRVDLPGKNWDASAIPTKSHVVLQTQSGPRRAVNVIDYRGALAKDFIKPNQTGDQAIDEYIRWETAHHQARDGAWVSRVIARNVEGSVTPNALWSLDNQRTRIYWVTMFQEDRLISISYQQIDPPFTGEAELLAIFRSVRFMSPKELDEVFRTETNLKR